MRGFNKVICAGNVGRDPEIRTMPNGNLVANFSIGSGEQWTDKASGEKKERTEWFNVVCFGKLAEIAEKYVTKGKPVLVEGKQRTETYEKDGTTRYITKLYADQLLLLGSGGGREASPEQQEEAARRAPAGEAPTGDAPQQNTVFDDDIPF